MQIERINQLNAGVGTHAELYLHTNVRLGRRTKKQQLAILTNQGLVQYMQANVREVRSRPKSPRRDTLKEKKRTNEKRRITKRRE